MIINGSLFKRIFIAIEEANKDLKKLRNGVRNCNTDTPEIAASISRYMEQAWYESEVTIEEYNNNLTLLKKETDRFKRNCSCLIKSIAGKYD